MEKNGTKVKAWALFIYVKISFSFPLEISIMQQPP
jgi:hypothetical protein